MPAAKAAALLYWTTLFERTISPPSSLEIMSYGRGAKRWFAATYSACLWQIHVPTLLGVGAAFATNLPFYEKAATPHQTHKSLPRRAPDPPQLARCKRGVGANGPRVSAPGKPGRRSSGRPSGIGGSEELSRSNPQESQNRALGGCTFVQRGHVRGRGLPQAAQKSARCRFSLLHRGQTISLVSSHKRLAGSG